VYLKKFRTPPSSVRHRSAVRVMPLLTLPEAVRNFKAIDSRDKVFVLLSLSSKNVVPSKTLSAGLESGTELVNPSRRYPDSSIEYRFMGTVHGMTLDDTMREVLKLNYSKSDIKLLKFPPPHPL
jgi:hypothetical protein